MSAPAISRRLMALMLAAALAAAVGCGRKGRPQPPKDDEANEDGGES